MLNMIMKAAAARAVFMVISRELRNRVDQSRASMLDTNTVNRRMSLPRTNSCARQPRAIDTKLY
jgi:hypothetical protein